MQIEIDSLPEVVKDWVNNLRPTEPVVFVKNGKPLIERKAGRLAHTGIVITDDAFAPINDDDLKAWFGDAF